MILSSLISFYSKITNYFIRLLKELSTWWCLAVRKPSWILVGKPQCKFQWKVGCTFCLFTSGIPNIWLLSGIFSITQALKSIKNSRSFHGGLRAGYVPEAALAWPRNSSLNPQLCFEWFTKGQHDLESDVQQQLFKEKILKLESYEITMNGRKKLNIFTLVLILPYLPKPLS